MCIRRPFTSPVLFLALCAVAGADDAPPVEPDPIEGKWSRTVDTNAGPVRVVKEHRDGKTTLETFDAAGNLLAAKTSDYELIETEHVRIFTFFNNVVTAGPGTGQVAPDTSSYVYRIEGKRFFEVRGLLKDQDEPFNVLVWERVEDD